jgi:hypothetical protein
VTRRFRPTDAFVDESIRGARYLLGCVLVDLRDAGAMRRKLDDLVLGGGRLHFHNESARRRRELLAEMARLPISCFVVVFHRTHGITEFVARERALRVVIERLQQAFVSRLVIESRQDDRDDQRTIARARSATPPLVFEHRAGADEPLLWVADGVTWAAGAGASWRSIVEHVLDAVIDLP